MSSRNHRRSFYLPPEAIRWKALRKQVWQRDGGRCTRCGDDLRGKRWEVHHLLPRSEGGRDILTNLALRCVPCHKKDTAEMHARHKKERAFLPGAAENCDQRFTTCDRQRWQNRAQRHWPSLKAPPQPQAHKDKDNEPMGLNLNELYPSTYLKADEFEEGEQRVLTIADVKLETLGKPGAQQEEKPVAYFSDSKPMVLNKTNAHVIGKLYGTQTDDWVGQRITVFAMDVDSFGEIVRALRVRPTVPGRGAASVPAPPSQSYAAQPQPSPGYASPTPAAHAPALTNPSGLTGSQMKEIIRELCQEGAQLGMNIVAPRGPADFPAWQVATRDAIAAKRGQAPADSFDSFEDDNDPFADS